MYHLLPNWVDFVTKSSTDWQYISRETSMDSIEKLKKSPMEQFVFDKVEELYKKVSKYVLDKIWSETELIADTLYIKKNSPEYVFQTVVDKFCDHDNYDRFLGFLVVNWLI